MGTDIDLLREIKELTSKGVSLSFYDCNEGHLHHSIPYEAKYLEDIVIRIYKDSAEENIQEQINNAKRNIINLLKKEKEDFDSSGYKPIYRYLYQHLNFSKRDIQILENE